VQCRIMPDAQVYMTRQREAGKSHKEAMRCLKRHLSNVVYRHLVADARSALWQLDNIEGLVRAA
jgi:transposase